MLKDRIMEDLKEHPDGCSTRSLQQRLEVRGAQLRRALAGLREDGQIETIDGEASGFDARIHKIRA
jgi:DNA-binding IscR family transcriptional regulator